MYSERFPVVHSLLGRHYTEAEWEALCDGCGECCFESNWNGSQWVDGSRACRYLDLESRRCWVYGQRFEAEKDCVRVSPEVVLQDIQPVNCAYRKLAERIIDEDYSGYDPRIPPPPPPRGKRRKIRWSKMQGRRGEK